ncbi:sclerostin [Salarias fasciatus]|uniref:Sclerostin n=1 Tax=Salarias fasciatus TaxID=181472 RepID=A0A672HVK5_SALFA|nr:sclerostin-like [Salarias fasciatus]
MQVSPAVLVSRRALPLLLLLLLLQFCCAAARGRSGVRNGATEVLPEDRDDPRSGTGNLSAANGSDSLSNRATQGARSGTEPGAGELGCREQRSARSVSDGWCRSAEPVRELRCSGQCLPSRLLPNAIGRGRWWRGGASDYRCVPAHFRTRRVRLRCPDGAARSLKLRLPTSCQCKRSRPAHNRSDAVEPPAPPRRRKQHRSHAAPPTGNSF